MELPPITQPPAKEHLEFDQICSSVDEFEPLPTLKAEPLEREQETEGESSLDGQILAGLVSPC